MPWPAERRSAPGEDMGTGTGRILLTASILFAAGSAGTPFSSMAATSPPAAAPSPEGGTPSPGPTWTLGQVVEIALARHPHVSQADADTAAAAARRGQALSTYYPSITLSAGASRSRTFSSSVNDSVDSKDLFAQGSLNQLVTDFGRREARAGQAGSLLEAAREGGRSVRQNVAFNAKTAYFDVLRAGRILSVNRETVAQRESLLRQASAFYEAGIRARIDVSRAEASLFQARADLTASENDLRVARLTLLQRMGVDGPPDYALADALATETIEGTIDGWLREAEETLPDLRAARERERAAEEALRAARAEHYYPVLTGSGSYGYRGDGFPLRDEYTLQALLSYPLFTGFLTREKVREAEAGVASAKAGVTDLRRLVRLQVSKSAFSMREASERIEARRKEVDAARENLRLARGRYEVGAGDIIEMTDAQVQAAQAEATLVDAQYDLSVQTAALLRAIGRW